ncbi:MAG: DUF3108 domain-containing protein [Burkholderiales bacterium]|nr:DUF3108 domain-containing protein [Burkholderiales bacterium]
MRRLISLAALSAALGAQAAPPPRVEIAYELRRDGAVVAEVRDRLEHDGRSYRLTETWKGKGLYALRGEATRRSRGAIGADGLRPEEFEEERPGRAATRTRIGARSQDRLSVLWHFAFHPPAAPVRVTVVDGKGSHEHLYAPAGRERVKTPAGEFDALRLVRDGDERRVQVWLAADRGHLPVRLRITEADGTTLEQVAVRIVP